MNHDTEQPFRLDQMAPRPRRRTGLIAGLVAGGVVLVVGATVAVTLAATRDGGTPAAPQTQAAAATPPAATSAPTTAAAAATAPATRAPAVLTLGAKADGPKVTAVAYSFKQPVAVGAPKPDQDGYEWGAVDVEICSKIDSYLNHSSWLLVYADHTRIEPSSTGYRQFPEPKYPWGDTDVSAGQCIRGWITYAVPTGKRPSVIEYQPQSFRADWQVT